MSESLIKDISRFFRTLILFFQLAGKPVFWLILSFIQLISWLFIGLGMLIYRLKFNLLSKKVIYILFLLGIMVCFIYYNFIKLVYDLPNPDNLDKREVVASSKIYDRNGTLLYSVYKDKNRSLARIDEIPQQVKLATLAAEDANFYDHPGFSTTGIVRAVIKFLLEGKITGGSTITQQLVKNTLLSPEQTLTRKVKEIFLSVLVENKYTKEEILTMYLNEINFGGTAYGIKAAANKYFGKDIQELDIAESAFLAGLIKSPTLLSPYAGDRQISINRKNYVVSLMHEKNFITDQQRKRALERELKFRQNREEMKAGHFVMYVRKLMAKKYGETVLSNSGLEIQTSLDYELQKFVEKTIKDELEEIKHLNVDNAAALVLDAQNGEILAMAGSKDYFGDDFDGKVNVLLRPRQPGSAIKPINYAYALSSGDTPATFVQDTPASFEIEKNQPPYKPKNYDGKFRGRITIRSALAESRNVPAVKILKKHGVHKMADLGRKMGISTWDDPKRIGLSLTLGGTEVMVFDLAQAYQVFANKGEKIKISAIKEVKNKDNDYIYKRDCSTGLRCRKEQVISKEVAFLITDILSDNEARSPAFGLYSSLVIPKHPEVAVKTGTSNNLHDNLTIGYNQDYVVAVWVGNNDNTPMSRIASGVTGASPIWNRIMSHLLANKESVPWEVPENIVKKSACGTSEYFLKDSFHDPCVAAASFSAVD